MRKNIFFAILILIFFHTFTAPLFCNSAAQKDKAASMSGDVPDSTLKSYQYKTGGAQTSQKLYKIDHDGSSENSNSLTYQNITGHKTYEDNDLDGRFGESESRLQDLDQDGRRGESEAQLGTEFVHQGQKITTLNNMGSASSLSSFKAAGQTPRKSIFVKEESSNDEKIKEVETAKLEEKKARAQVLVA